jgi:BclB C-terminal domain-containing protein
VLTGLAGNVGLAGFGNSGITVLLAGNTVDLTGAGGSLLNFAFSVPRDGTITSIAAYFSTTIGLALVGTTVTINAQLFSSTTPDNTFTAIPGTQVVLSPSLTGILALGETSDGILDGIAVPVTAGTRLLLAFFITVDGIDLVTTVAGYGSAGITID